MNYFLSILFLFSTQVQAQSLNSGKVILRTPQIEIDLNHFNPIHQNKEIEVQFLKKSLQWIRSDKNVLFPQVLLQIKIPAESVEPVSVKKDHKLIVLSQKDHFATTEFYVNLFAFDNIQVFKSSKKVDEIKIKFQNLSSDSKNLWIDDSCLPYQLKIKSLQTESIAMNFNQYLTVACQLQRVGTFGHEKPRLEVTLSGSNLKWSDDDEVKDLTFYFNETAEMTTYLVPAQKNESQKINLSVVLPEKLPRLKLAAGLGPYSFSNNYQNEAQGPQISFSYMLYGKLTLTESTSLKAFDALIYDKTLFNNSGLYYAFDVGRFFDDRITFGTLLGFQALHYRYDESSKTEFEITYPQGLEITYLHPFGLENYYLSYGMFLSATQETYRNIWIRFGQSFFYEINYINWKKDISHIEMWGLSVGFPLMSYF